MSSRPALLLLALATQVACRSSGPPATSAAAPADAQVEPALAIVPPAAAASVRALGRSGAADAGADVAVTTGAKVPLVAQPVAQPVQAPAVRCGDWQLLDTIVRGSISESLSRALPQDGVELAAHLARIFMWDLNLRRDVEAGDRVRLLWRRNPAGDPEIGSARYQSQRLAQAFWVYRFSSGKDDYPSYWDRQGVELPRRLKASPLAAYEQITALLKDRPTHQGLDFKTPEGTEVQVPRAGVVTRRDWKLRGNGHCVEVRFDDGTLAKFLHLSAIKVKAGARVRAGQIIALTGNTGRSTAPHLHYQLNRGARTVDPVDYHGVLRRRLEGAALTSFRNELADFERRCGDAVP
jgi:murein DD-endopeptidase